MGEEQTSDLRDAVIGALRTVYDPEIPVNIHDLGLIYEVEVAGEGEDAPSVHIVMTLTSPMCPVAEQMPGMVENAVKSVDGVGAVVVDLTWEPPWDMSRMSEAARLEMNV